MSSTSDKVRALSIQQPWAALILHGGKTVENRSWATDWRGTLAVHAGQRIDPAAVPLAEELGSTDLPTGAYLGFVDLVDVHHAGTCGRCTKWSEPNAWHWVLTRPRALTEPIPGRGHLRLYRPPAEVLVARLALNLGGGDSA